jgi:hypothetical protein
MDEKINDSTCGVEENEWSGNLAIKNCEFCQDRKVAAISRPLYVFGISRASFPDEPYIEPRPCTWH